MTTLADFITTIRGYTGVTDVTTHSDALVTSWVRMFEESCNSELRIGDMIQIDTALITQQRVVVPSDWLHTEILRIIGGGVLDYMSTSEFYSKHTPKGFFTTSGRYMMLGGTPDSVNGRTVEIHYMGEVPVLTSTDGSSWLVDRFPSLAIAGTLKHANLRTIDASVDWGAEFNSIVARLNENHRASKAPHGGISRKVRRIG